MQPEIDKKQLLLILAALIAAVWCAYYPSISVPFYLDDYDSIIENPLIHSKSLEPLLNSGLIYRIVGYITLWGNYHIHGLEPAWYHAVNIGIHTINGILVYFVAKSLFDFFPHSGRGVFGNQIAINRFWALAIAMLWVLHPLNSLPVIYVVQRLTSIVALFMLLTIIFYIRSRKCSTLTAAVPFMAITAICCVAGLFAKQNFVVIFVFLYFWELVTGSLRVRRNLLRLTAAGLIALVFIGPLPFMAGFWQSLDSFTRDAYAPDRLHYFYTQMIVLWDYIFRFFLPLQSQLNIHFELKDSFEPLVALAMLAHIGVVTAAMKLRRKMPLLLVGIILFYSSHTVESFIIPIKDLAFEHRTYFGNLGLLLALAAVIKHYLYTQDVTKERLGGMYVAIFSICVLGMFGIFNRAVQWQDPVSFYEREVQLSPEHARANASYGNELAKLGRMEEAEKYLKKSIELNIANGTITAGVLNSYMNVLYQQRKFQKAAPVVMMGLKHIHHPIRRSTLLSNLAVGYIYMGYCDFALGLLQQAIKLNAENKDAVNNLNYCLQGS